MSRILSIILSLNAVDEPRISTQITDFTFHDDNLYTTHISFISQYISVMETKILKCTSLMIKVIINIKITVSQVFCNSIFNIMCWEVIVVLHRFLYFYYEFPCILGKDRGVVFSYCKLFS